MTSRALAASLAALALAATACGSAGADTAQQVEECIQERTANGESNVGKLKGYSVIEEVRLDRTVCEGLVALRQGN